MTDPILQAAKIIDPVAFDPMSLSSDHPGWIYRRETATMTAAKIVSALRSSEDREDHPVEIRLRAIQNNIQRWRDFDKERRDKEGLTTSDNTLITSPPVWPTHGALKWLDEALEEAVAILPVPFSGEGAAGREAAISGNDLRETCKVCNGRGEVGWFDTAENAWRTERCTDCEEAA